MEGIVIAAVVTLGVIALIEWTLRRSARAREYDVKPSGCSCLWLDADDGPFRALSDLNCSHHEGS